MGAWCLLAGLVVMNVQGSVLALVLARLMFTILT
jgi:hypothetical protein